MAKTNLVKKNIQFFHVGLYLNTTKSVTWRVGLIIKLQKEWTVQFESMNRYIQKSFFNTAKKALENFHVVTWSVHINSGCQFW